MSNEVRVKEIAFTGYSITDLKCARAFYEGTLGLECSRIFGKEKAWIEYDIGPGTLAISNFIPDWKPSPGGGIVGLEVEDFESAVGRLKDDGAVFLGDTFETPVCHMAFVQDPDGNTIIIHKRKV